MKKETKKSRTKTNRHFFRTTGPGNGVKNGGSHFSFMPTRCAKSIYITIKNERKFFIFICKMMKEYLIETFNYNERANNLLLTAIQSLPDKEEAIKLFSHLIRAQDKWFNRVEKKADDSTMTWFGPVFAEHELAQRWKQSVANWVVLLESGTEAGLANNVTFTRPSDGKTMGVSLKDLCLQLNYHSIHHRAQINSLISRQGVKVPVTDYIFTALKELD